MTFSYHTQVTRVSQARL